MSIGELKTVFLGRLERILERVFLDRCKNLPKERKLSPTDMSVLQNSMSRSYSKIPEKREPSQA
jgi:hypothetical protein